MFACEMGDKKRPATSRTRMAIRGKKRRMIAYKGSDKGKKPIKRQNLPDAKTSSENLRYHSPTLSTPFYGQHFYIQNHYGSGVKNYCQRVLYEPFLRASLIISGAVSFKFLYIHSPANVTCWQHVLEPTLVKWVYHGSPLGSP
jgi:hypothetical protein